MKKIISEIEALEAKLQLLRDVPAAEVCGILKEFNKKILESDEKEDFSEEEKKVFLRCYNVMSSFYCEYAGVYEAYEMWPVELAHILKSKANFMKMLNQ